MGTRLRVGTRNRLVRIGNLDTNFVVRRPCGNNTIHTRVRVRPISKTR